MPSERSSSYCEYVKKCKGSFLCSPPGQEIAANICQRLALPVPASRSHALDQRPWLSLGPRRIVGIRGHFPLLRPASENESAHWLFKPATLASGKAAGVSRSAAPFCKWDARTAESTRVAR